MFKSPDGFSFDRIPAQGFEAPTEATHPAIDAWSPASTVRLGDVKLANAPQFTTSDSLNCPPLFGDARAPYALTPQVADALRQRIDQLPVASFVADSLIAVDNRYSPSDTYQALSRLDDLAAQKGVSKIDIVDASQKDKADFVIKADGNIEFVPNASKAPGDKSSIVVAVEKPTDATASIQQQTIDWFVGEYLTNQFMKTRPDGTINGTINDNNRLSPDVKEDLTQPVEPTLPDQAVQNVRQAARQFAPNVDGSPREGTISADDTNQLFSDRHVSKRETADESPILDSIGAIFSGNRENSDTYVNVGRDGKTILLGTYGLTFVKINEWLTDCGFPPNLADMDDAQAEALIQSLVAQHKISHAFAHKLMSADFRKRFAKFLDGVKHGHKPSADEMKEFLPDKLQTKIAMALVDKYDTDTGGKHDAGEIARMWVLDGKKPKNASDCLEVVQGADNLAAISKARSHNPSHKAVHWTSESSVNSDGSTGVAKLNCKLVDNAQKVVDSMHSKGGWCEAGVESAIRKTGYNMPCLSDAYKFTAFARRHPEMFTEISAEQADNTPGAIMVSQANRAFGHKSGHIRINGGDGVEYSDKQRRLMTADIASARHYGETAAFVLNPDYKKA